VGSRFPKKERNKPWAKNDAKLLNQTNLTTTEIFVTLQQTQFL